MRFEILYIQTKNAIINICWKINLNQILWKESVFGLRDFLRIWIQVGNKRDVCKTYAYVVCIVICVNQNSIKKENKIILGGRGVGIFISVVNPGHFYPDPDPENLKSPDLDPGFRIRYTITVNFLIQIFRI